MSAINNTHGWAGRGRRGGGGGVKRSERHSTGRRGIKISPECFRAETQSVIRTAGVYRNKT